MQPFAQITTISFDADGTLFDFERVMRRGLALVLEEISRLVPDSAEELTVDDLIEIRNLLGIELRGQGISHEAIRLEAFRRVLERLGHPSESLAFHLNGLYMRHRYSDIRAYPDVKPTLAILKPHYTLGVISNGNSYPERCGLGGIFQFTVLSQDHGVEKPDPRLFWIALEEAGCNREQLLHVGDSLHTDVLGAQAAGVTCAWLNREGIPKETFVNPDYEIKTLAELPGLVGLTDAPLT